MTTNAESNGNLPLTAQLESLLFVAAEPAPLASQANVGASAAFPETGSPRPLAKTPSPDTASASANQARRVGPESEPARASAPLPEGRSRLTFTFETESWVEIREANGEILYSALNPAGSRKEIVGTAPFTMVIGNASGVRLTRNGEPVVLTPRASDVARLTLE